MLMTLMVFCLLYGVCLAQPEFNEDGELETGPIAKISAHFPQVTGGFTVIIQDDEVYFTPAVGFRYRVIDYRTGGWKSLILFDFLSVEVGAENAMLGIHWELIPDTLSVGAGAAYTITGEQVGIYPYCGFQVLKF